MQLAVVDRSERRVSGEAPREALLHQAEAIDQAVQMLVYDDRTKVVMPTGTGKTLVGQRVAEYLGDQTLLVEPSLALVAQNLKAWQRDSLKPNTRYLVVCGDDTVVQINEDHARVELDELPARVTNDPEVIREFLKDKSTPCVIVSTLHSLHLVAEAQKEKSVPSFTGTVVDEAHLTATKNANSSYGLVLDEEAIKSDKRLFVTATPRFVRYKNGTDEGEVISMDNEKLYGKTAYNLPFREAVERGLITDYEVIVMVGREAPTQELSLSARYELVRKASEEHGLKRIVTYSSRVDKAHELHRLAEEKGDVTSFVVDGKMPSSLRERIFDAFGSPGGDLRELHNCNVLREGIDVPTIDAVAFVDRRDSAEGVVQAVGRAVRTAPGKNVGRIIIPVLLKEGDNLDEKIENSEFRKVIQILRALSTADDGLKQLLTREARNDLSLLTTVRGEGGERVKIIADEKSFDIDSVKSAVLIRGMRVRGELLSVHEVKRLIILHKERTGEWPSANSGDVYERDPDDREKWIKTENTWTAIDQAGRAGRRGLQMGMTLTQIKRELGVVTDGKELSVEEVKRLLVLHKERTGTWPSRESGDVYERDAEQPSWIKTEDTWLSIDQAGRWGRRGLPIGMTLIQIKRELGVRNEIKELPVQEVKRLMALHKERTGSWPTKVSGDVYDKNPYDEQGWIQTGENWAAIDRAGVMGYRGLPKGLTLAKLKRELGVATDVTELSVDEVKRLITLHKERTGSWPHKRSGDVYDRDPDDREKWTKTENTWTAIDQAGGIGARGLPKGMTLAKIKVELGVAFESKELSVEEVKKLIIFHKERTGTWPSQHSGDVYDKDTEEQGRWIKTKDTWKSINMAGQNGHRGLPSGMTLARLKSELSTPVPRGELLPKHDSPV